MAKQHAVHKCFVGCGYVVDVVDGLIERSICVDVSSETETFALKIIEHVLARIVLRAVESHVLEGKWARPSCSGVSSVDPTFWAM